MSELRQDLMKTWLSGLASIKANVGSIAPASSDASFRRYFRVADRDTGQTYIVMDAPPDKEDTRPFVSIAKRLIDAGVNAPTIIEASAEQGFLLLTDFGSTTMLSSLKSQQFEADAMYRQAMLDLVHIQAKTDPQGLPSYSEERLRAEMGLFDEWYIGRHFGASLDSRESDWLAAIKTLLVKSAMAEGQVFVHRDYHSRNLMTVPTELGQFTFGVLDFQDAVLGPVSYDLVSILRDAYIEWPEDQTLDWAIRYWEAARKAGVPVPSDVSEFYRQFDYMGLQRHLKILGIFARLNYRDGKAQYLQDLPLVLAYVRSVAHRYMAFKPLLVILDRLENKAVQVGYTF